MGSHVLAVLVGRPGGHVLPSLHHQLLIKIKSGHRWLDTLVPDPWGWSHCRSSLDPCAISRQDTSRADAINNAVTIRDILQGLPPPTPGHPPPSDSVAAQSLVTLGNQRCLCCAPPSSGRDHACHPPNTELTVSTNQENKWKNAEKES